VSRSALPIFPGEQPQYGRALADDKCASVRGTVVPRRMHCGKPTGFMESPGGELVARSAACRKRRASRLVR
jgi:hypothetical protein